MKFLFTSWPTVAYQSVTLTSVEANNRMLSFYFLRDLPRGFLKRYLDEGFVLSDEQEALAAFLKPDAGEE